MRSLRVPMLAVALAASSPGVARADAETAVGALWTHATEVCSTAFDDADALFERLAAESPFGPEVAQTSEDGAITNVVDVDGPYWFRFERVDAEGDVSLRCNVYANDASMQDGEAIGEALASLLQGVEDIRLVGGAMSFTDLYGETPASAQIYLTEPSYLFEATLVLEGREVGLFAQVLDQYLSLSFQYDRSDET